MALVECPECGKEISDQAKRCPNCGYQKPRFRNNIFQKKHIAIIGGCFVVVLVIFLFCLMRFKIRSPFEKFSADMTKEEVRKEFGEPMSKKSSFNIDDFNNSSFVGLDGMLFVCYSDDDIIEYVEWRYDLKDGEEFSDFSEQIDQIIEFFTDKYGSPKELDEYLIWEDSVGQQYIFYTIESADHFVPEHIFIRFEL